MSSKRPAADADSEQALQINQYKPVHMLKNKLLRKLDISDEHFFRIFATYRFQSSVRKTKDFKEILETMRHMELRQYNDPSIAGYLTDMDCIRASQSAYKGIESKKKDGS
jgi:hypothetical protein